MHLLLEQYSESAKWHSKVADPMYLGTATNNGVFKCADAQSVTSNLTQDSVVVLFLHPTGADNDAEALAVIIDKFKGFAGTELKIWCHYGGDINLQELPDHWASYDRLPRIGNANAKQSLDDFFASKDTPYPYPFSSNFDLDWRHEIESASVKVKAQQWQGTLSLLDEAWKRAEKRISQFKNMRAVCRAASWHIVVNEIKACLDRIRNDPDSKNDKDGSTIDDWRKLCELAHTLGIGQPAPSHVSETLEDHYKAISGSIYTMYTHDEEKNDCKGGVRAAESVSDITALALKRTRLSMAITKFTSAYSKAVSSLS